jgi:hypothetical protein
LIWSEAMSRATVFLTVLSASIIVLALLPTRPASDRRPPRWRLRCYRSCCCSASPPTCAWCRSTARSSSHHDDERGLVTTYMLDRPSQLRLWLHFLVNTPTIATVDAALAAVIAMLIVQAAEAPRAAVVGGGVMAFLAVWGTLFPPAAAHPPPLRHKTPKFPTPPEAP